MPAKTRALIIFFVFCIFFLCITCTGYTLTVSLSAIPYAFNPSAGSLKINISPDDTGHTDICALIIDNKGTVARYLTADVAQGQILWDGRLNDGQPAPEGNYTVKVIPNAGRISVPQFFIRGGQSLISNNVPLLYYPYSPAVDRQGNIYVTDGTRNCVMKFDRYGNFLKKWGMTGKVNGTFDRPTGIAVDSAGNLYVADSKNNRIQKFDSEGRYLLQFGTSGKGDGQFDGPTGVAVAPDGNIYVADTWNYRIQYFDAKGNFLGKWGNMGSSEGSFNYPAGIAVGNSGTVYVTDKMNDRIQQFNLTGKYLGSLGNDIDHPLAGPAGIVVSNSGNIMVTEDGNRVVSEYSPDGLLLRREALDWYASPSGRMSGSLALAISNGYIARQASLAGNSAGFVCLTERSCLQVNSLSPLQVGNPVSTAVTRNVILDRSAPTIDIASPINGFSYRLNQKVQAVWSAGDSISGLDSAGGSSSNGAFIDTSYAGSHDFLVQAVDRAGNNATLTNRYYIVDSAAYVSSRASTQVSNPGQGTTGGSGSTATPTPSSTPVVPAPTPTPVPTGQPTANPGPIGAMVQLGSTQIGAEVARSSDEINQGLMYRTSMAGDRGMLFVFSGDGMHSFWMENTYIPLDMIFIDSDLQIVNIHANAQPLSTHWISSGSPCHYVLEVNAGVAGSSGISVGDKVTVNWV